MRIVKIKNRKFFNAKSWNDEEKRPYTAKEKKNFLESSHFYAAYYDRKNKEYRYIPTTHLYKKDEERFRDLSAKKLRKEKFSFSEVPSAVRDGYRTKDRYGNKIKPTSEGVTIISKRHLPKKQSKRIKDFAKNKLD